MKGEKQIPPFLKRILHKKESPSSQPSPQRGDGVSSSPPWGERIGVRGHCDYFPYFYSRKYFPLKKLISIHNLSRHHREIHSIPVGIKGNVGPGVWFVWHAESYEIGAHAGSEGSGWQTQSLATAPGRHL